MSLARACLRLAAVAALRGNTLAGDLVFDSRIGALDGLMPDERKPVIAVYTEEEEGGALAPNRGPPFEPWVELVFEITFLEADQADGDSSIDLCCPTTDDELEMSLDVLEQQIRTILFEDLSRPLSALFRKAYRGARHLKSMRYREEQKAGRFAARYMIITLEVPDEPIFQAYDESLQGLDLLPPTFRSIATAWPDGLEEKNKALAIATAFAQPELARGLVLSGRAQAGPDRRSRLPIVFPTPRRP